MAGLFLQLPAQDAAGFLQFFRISGASLAKFFQCVFRFLFFSADPSDFRLRLGLLPADIFLDAVKFLPEFSQFFLRNCSLFEAFNLPQHRIWRDLLLLPFFQAAHRILPVFHAFPVAALKFIQVLQRGKELLITGGIDLSDQLFFLFLQFPDSLFQLLLIQLLLFHILLVVFHLHPDRRFQFSQLQYLQSALEIPQPGHFSFLFLIAVESAADFRQFLHFRLDIPDTPAEPSILSDTFLHIFNVDFLLHADIFPHKFRKLHVHTEWDRTFEQPGKTLRIQPAQIVAVHLCPEPLVGRLKIIIFRVHRTPDVRADLIDGHGTFRRPVAMRRKRTLMPEENLAVIVGSAGDVKSHADTLTLPGIGSHQFHDDG